MCVVRECARSGTMYYGCMFMFCENDIADYSCRNAIYRKRTGRRSIAHKTDAKITGNHSFDRIFERELKCIDIAKMSDSEKSTTMQNSRFSYNELRLQRPSPDNSLVKYLNSFRTNEISTDEYKEYVQQQSDQIREINVSCDANCPEM